EIMRSRNDSIVLIRRHERDLAHALARLEEVANDLKRKNHLLETARQNLADAGRLASLGMMSAGIAHELNTPLAVVKGLVERLAGRPDRSADEAEVALLLRVLGRLERLSESLLDLARVRPPRKAAIDLAGAVREAITLVDLDRGKGRVRFESRVSEGFVVEADPDRLVQVLVNLVRNAVDALQGSPADNPRVEIAAERAVRDGADWVSIRVLDNGPGIDPAVLPDIFEPFVSTRLDARGTGLGLAVAEGIVREHGGVVLARNRPGRAGAEFEIMLPATDSPGAACRPETARTR
ncbi:MAG TPA: ATP-binding protein, partial [Phycisphaerales bacterium]|nr:ATP-binding protein [Phycisphaerales bacterium]